MANGFVSQGWRGAQYRKQFQALTLSISLQSSEFNNYMAYLVTASNNTVFALAGSLPTILPRGRFFQGKRPGICSESDMVDLI